MRPEHHDVALGNHDVALGNHDVALGKQDVALGKQDVALGKQDVALGNASASQPKGMWWIRPAALVVVLLALTVAGCTTRKSAASEEPPPIVTLSPGAVPDNNPQQIVVHISNNQFERDIYECQPGDVTLILRTGDGPYLFYVDGLVDRRELPANADTVVRFNVSDPGRYTMHLALSTPQTATATETTATLDVRPVGGR